MLSSKIPVVLDAADRVSVGQTLRALAQNSPAPKDARDAMSRVGDALACPALTIVTIRCVPLRHEPGFVVRAYLPSGQELVQGDCCVALADGPAAIAKVVDWLMHQRPEFAIYIEPVPMPCERGS